MKIVAIGDVHGRNTWEKILEKEPDYDVVVFIGDYFDSFDIDAETQLTNFRRITRLKNKKPDQVVLLFGNHDLHYLLDGERYSGYQEEYAEKIASLLSRNELQWAFNYQDLLFTHAGVTKTWVENHLPKYKNLVDAINALPLKAFKFEFGGNFDRTGDDKHQSPVWVRPHSLLLDMVDGYTQVVGHTERNTITHFEEKLIMIDCPHQYIVFTDKGAFVKSL